MSKTVPVGTVIVLSKIRNQTQIASQSVSFLPFILQTCAIKVESCTSNKQVLKMEVAVLKRLQNSSIHICKFIGCGRNSKVNYVIMTLLGPNLSELRKRQPNQNFSISTTLRVGVQIVAAVQAMHDCGFLHRDIKPSNFSIGNTPDTSRTCFMLDYGLARQYTTVTGEVRQPRPVAGFRGTVRYASLNAHLSRDLGRHDDLWSVFYLMVELAVGHLPWRRIRDKEEAGEFKAKYDHRKLIRNLPHEFLVFLEHLKSSSYYDKPDYALITGCLQDAITRLAIQEADPFDWEQDFSAPSLTTASMVSPPAVKLVNEGQGEMDGHSPMKTLQTSKTNCSGVVELSDNGPSNERRVNLTVPQQWPFIKKFFKSSNSRSQKVEGTPDKSTKPSKLSSGAKILNKYLSEEEEEEEEDGVCYGDAKSSGNSSRQRSRKESNRKEQEYIFEGVPHASSYQTESLNRFYELAAKESVASYKSFSKKSNEKGRPLQHVSSQYFTKTSDRSESSKENAIFNNAMVHPEKQDFVNAFNDDIALLPSIRVQKPQLEEKEGSCSIKKEESHSTKEEAKPSLGEGTRSTESQEESVEESEQSSDKSKKRMMFHKLLTKSSSSQSDSTKSIEVLFAQKTLNTDSSIEHAKADGHRGSHKKTQDGIPEHRTFPLLNVASGSVRGSEPRPRKLSPPLLLSTTSDQMANQVLNNKSAKTASRSSETRKTKSASTFLEILPNQMRIHPRPPPNPPPHNYTMSLMARRRRFVRSKLSKDGMS